MANELEIINNPTSTPALVSTGYQAQNVRSLAASNGIDLSFVEAYDATTVRLRQSGAVDVSGTLYAVGAQVDFTVSSAGRYFIYLADGGDASHKTPTLGTDAGTFDAELNARYLSTGERVLNWLIVKETVGSTKLTVLRMSDPGKLAAHNEPLLLQRTEITSAGTTTWTAPRSQVYTFELQACGGDGGQGATDGTYDGCGGGGGGGGYSKQSEFVAAGTVLTLTRSVTSSANCQVAGVGFTTIAAENGANGSVNTGDDLADGGAGGVGNTRDGQTGHNGDSTFRGSGVNPQSRSGFGGNSFYGNGGFGGVNNDGTGYGGGGHGQFTATPGTGAPGLFLIWG